MLVTSTGDINLGGTVTAQGNGTGAGGNIVTKAAGVDNVESGANLLAAGGAPGEGGHIEVSGKDVVLDGNIDPGNGGSLLLDPKNIIVTPTSGSVSANVSTGSNPGGTTKVKETWVAQHLQADQNVTLTAQSRHHLHGRHQSGTTDFNCGRCGGNLTVTAGESILFSDAKDYTSGPAAAKWR